MDTARRLLPALPVQARRCRGEGCGLRADCLRHRELDAQQSAAPGALCRDTEDHPFFLLAPRA